ncbi:hypothetical protein [Ochrovirga pacifica]|uniref:hypothetical protein n=1 Tax=Ochrovirga pacifica TaxID=1042376 RepID=UPI000255A51A|nr:hypothetical protein [Ochrovirga pacifica]
MQKVSKILSYLLHPVLLPSYGTLWYLQALPIPLSAMQKYMVLFIVLGGTFLVPLLTLVVLRLTGHVKTNDAKTVEERKFPVLIMIFNYLFLAQVLQSIWQLRELTILAYATAVGLVIAWLFLYNKVKVSLHMLGMAGLLSFVLVFGAHYQYPNLVVALLLVLLGALATARLHLKAHNLKEIYMGLTVGILLPIVFSFVL